MARTSKRTASRAKSKPRVSKLTLRDRLSRLTVYQATQLLGPHGSELMRHAGKTLEVCLDSDVSLTADRFRARIRDLDLPQGTATVTLSLKPDRHKSLDLRCDACGLPCHHQAAALDTLLNEKLYFGLAAPPDEQVPLENLTAEELHARAMSERRARATQERMQVRSLDPRRPWTDYSVTSRNSGKTYLVSMRGEELGAIVLQLSRFSGQSSGNLQTYSPLVRKVT